MSGLYFNGMKVFSYLAFDSPFTKSYGVLERLSAPLTFDPDDPFLNPASDPSYDPRMGDCIFATQMYPPCSSNNNNNNNNKDTDSSDTPTRTMTPEISTKPDTDDSDDTKLTPECLSCDILDPTQNDQARPIKDKQKLDDMKSRFDDRGTDQLLQTTRGIRMSTSAAGITIGIVTSVVMALLILIFAVYKMRHKNIIDQYGVTIEISEKNGEAPGKLPILTTNNIDDLNATSREHEFGLTNHVISHNQFSPSHKRTPSTSSHHHQVEKSQLNDFVHKNGSASNGKVSIFKHANGGCTTIKESSLNNNNISSYERNTNTFPRSVLATNNSCNIGRTTSPLLGQGSDLRSNSGRSIQGSYLDSQDTTNRKISYTDFNDGQLINMRDLSHLKEWYV